MRRLVPGGSNHSFGIHVAKLAGLPLPVTKKATKLLSNFQNKNNEIHYMNIDEMDISESKEDEFFFEEFDKVNVDEISPRQALDIFYKLKLLRNIK
mgnify:CR=1 FL=1